MFQPSEYIHTIDVVNRQKEFTLDSFLHLLPKVIAATLAVEKTRAKYIGVTFLSDSTMRRYHKAYFNDPSSTDCMSFPIDGRDSLDPENRCLGDIFLCPHVAKRMAKIEKTSQESELSLYAIHATLHLLGYDDIKEQDRKIMRQKEKEVLHFLKGLT